MALRGESVRVSRNRVAILLTTVGGQAVQADSPRERPIMRSIHTARRGNTKFNRILRTAMRRPSRFDMVRTFSLTATFLACMLSLLAPSVVAQETAAPTAPAHRGPTEGASNESM